MYPASYSKGLPHDRMTGLVRGDVYCLLLKALASNEPDDFEQVAPLGCDAEAWQRAIDAGWTPPPAGGTPPPPPPGLPPPQRHLENPQSGLAFELEGADPQILVMPPAPCFSSEQQAAEIAELYWMALTRDVPFSRYTDDRWIHRASKDLTAHFAPPILSPFLNGSITRRNIFRGPTRGDRKGPYLSQFLVMDVPFGAQFIPATVRTLRAGVDFLTDWNSWLSVQDGCDANQSNATEEFRLIRNGRDLAQFVHVDRDFNAFLNACQLLLFGRPPLRRGESRPGLGVPFGPCLPYRNVMAPGGEEFSGKSMNQFGQGTFGDQHVKSMVVGATYRAFNAVWYQKWFVHRRLRPEEFGGRVHLRRLFNGISANPAQNFPINSLLFQSRLFKKGWLRRHNARQNGNLRTPTMDFLNQPTRNGTWLLPMAYAEGSPLHPSYGSGHSTVAGCLVTILKAFFDNDWKFPMPLEPNDDGTALRPYRGRDAGRLTVAGELDKLASNIGIGRLWAGVHWRSDHEQSLILGEKLAISILCDQRNLYNEPYEIRFRSFDFGPYGGKVVRIRPGANQWKSGDACEACIDLLDPDQYAVKACERRRRPDPTPRA
jgi:hypothetical protein